MADDRQRPAEAANRADSQARQAHDVAEMTAARSPHDAAMAALSVSAPAAGYAREGS